jgi:hypothetical protein
MMDWMSEENGSSRSEAKGDGGDEDDDVEKAAGVADEAAGCAKAGMQTLEEEARVLVLAAEHEDRVEALDSEDLSLSLLVSSIGVRPAAEEATEARRKTVDSGVAATAADAEAEGVGNAELVLALMTSSVCSSTSSSSSSASSAKTVKEAAGGAAGVAATGCCFSCRLTAVVMSSVSS